MARDYGKWYTDYPIFEKERGKKAPIREIKVLHYDGDKYCRVEYQDRLFTIKTGYINPKPERLNTKYPCKRFKLMLKVIETDDFEKIWGMDNDAY